MIFHKKNEQIFVHYILNVLTWAQKLNFQEVPDSISEFIVEPWGWMLGDIPVMQTTVWLKTRGRLWEQPKEEAPPTLTVCHGQMAANMSQWKNLCANLKTNILNWAVEIHIYVNHIVWINFALLNCSLHGIWTLKSRWYAAKWEIHSDAKWCI